MRTLRTVAICSCALAALLSVSASARQAATGLRVAVTDARRQPVASALCTLAAAGDEARVIASATTDEQGVAAFARIAPGAYVLRVEREGFRAHVEGAVAVVAGKTQELPVVLSVASVSESVTVSAPGEGAAGVEAGASAPSGTLRREAVRRLPLASARVEDVLPLVPGVVRSTTGEISIKGASEQQSALLVNGLNASDPASGNFRLNLPVDSVEAVQVFQHPYTAEYGQFTGGVTRVETRRGGDRLHFEFNDFLPDPRWRRGAIMGIAEDTPHLNVNGPVVAGKLYFSQSLSYNYARTPVRGVPYPFDETKTESAASFTQLDLVASPKHAETFTFGFFPEHDQFVGLDFFRPREATPNYRQRDYVAAARDNSTLGGGLLESSLSFKRFDADVWGQGGRELTLTPTAEQGNYFAAQDRKSRRVELLEIYTPPAFGLLSGSHETKFGFDFNNVRSQLDFNARPVNVVRGDGTPAERIEFRNRPRPVFGSNSEFTAFAQDRWTARPNLSFDLGLRYEDQRIAQETNLAPRAGFAWSPFGGDRTVLRGGAGLFYDKIPLNIRHFARFPARTVTRYAADGATVIDSIFYRNVLVDTPPVEPLDLRRSSRGAGFVPENLTWNVQLDQAVTAWLTLRANVTGSRTEHIYIVNPESNYSGDSAVVLRSAGRAAYRAVELTARLKLKEKGEIFASYVRSRSRGDLNDFNSYFGDFGSPVIRENQYSNLPYDAPNRFIAWGTISLPRRFTVSPVFEARSGFPYSVRDAAQNFVGQRNSDATRFPRFVALDADISKDFQVTKKYAVRLSLRGFNLTNHFNPRDVRANTADPAFGQFFAPYRRYFTGGFDVLF